MHTLLILCTGNYYRSRFAEAYFRHLAAAQGLPWVVDSRGLRPDPRNCGNVSVHTVNECARLGLPLDPERPPRTLAAADLLAADHVVAVKESEHRPLMREIFPEWEDRVEYWEVHDLDVAPPEEALVHLRREVEQLAHRLQNGGQATPARGD